MEKYEEAQDKTTADFIAELMTDEQDGEEFSREYIKAGFLTSAMRTLAQARRQAGLTQAEVAERLHTKQTAVARWEKDKEGSMSLRHFVEFLLACGKAPLDIAIEAFGSLREYVIAHPEEPRTQELYQAWMKKISEPIPVPQYIQAPVALTTQKVINAVPLTNLTISSQEGMHTVKFVEQFLKDQRQASDALLYLLQLPDSSITNISSEFQTSISNQPEGSQTFSTVNQEKAVAA